MDHHSTYRDHLERVTQDLQDALVLAAKHGESFGGVILHAGSERLYHRDDQTVPFRPDPHFARIVPAEGSDHLLVVPRGGQASLIQVVPRDYWHEAPRADAHPWVDALPHVVVESVDDAIEGIGERPSYAFVGDDMEVADALGIGERNVESKVFLSALDWSRGPKTTYEIECIREAARIGAAGHAAVREGAMQGLSERELHFAYLQASGLTDPELPYPNIIGWDDHAAVLHYESKDHARPEAGILLLIDAGGKYRNYTSDVTRTYLRPGAPDRFVALLDGMDVLQQELVAAVKPGLSYIDLHHQAHLAIAGLLHDVGVFDVPAAEAFELGLTHPFFPHGLGHHLGLQVHDVGGRQLDAIGTALDPPPEHPFLRTTRTLEVGHVVTIEPGVYFIPMLLDPLRAEPAGRHVDWKMVDEWIGLGGIRIEDDVLVTEDGVEDLTRPLTPGHR